MILKPLNKNLNLLLETLNFGPMFLGLPTSFRCFLINNSPHPQPFCTKIRSGSISDNQNQHSLITPYELGQEQSQSLIRCEPMEGIVGVYSQVEIVFKCETKISGKIW